MIERVIVPPCEHGTPGLVPHHVTDTDTIWICPGGRVVEIDREKMALAILAVIPRRDDECDIESDYCQRCLNDAREYVEVALAAVLGETDAQ